jgi:hypothetical protein
MTRKDYKLIANRLAELYEDIKMTETEVGPDALDFDRFMSRLCSDLKQDNQNFNSAKFRDAVYHE